MEKITIKDLYKYSFISEVNANSDGTKVLFTSTMAKDEANNYDCRIYCLDTASGEYKAITSKGSERSALWLDNDTILYTTVGNPEGKTSYYKQSVTGGEAVLAFTVDTKVGSIKALTEDSYLITTSKRCEEIPDVAENQAKLGKDYIVFDEIPFWMNAQGVRNKIRNNLMIYTVSTGELKTLSDKYMNVAGSHISEDASKILFWGPSYTDMSPKHSELFEYNIASGYCEKILPSDTLSVNFAVYIGDVVVMEGSDKKDNSSQNPVIYTIDKAREIKELVYLDGSFSGSVSSDMGYGGGKSLQVVGDKLYGVFTDWSNSYLSYLDLNGKLTYVNRVEGATGPFDIVGDTAYSIVFRDFEPQEVYSISLVDGAEKRLTNINKEFVETHNVIKPEYFTFTAKDGHTLEGWVVKPADFDETKKYPGILTIHGGPKVAYGTIYNHEIMCMANMGYFVFYTNPRGASGRGEEFSRLVDNLGVIDYQDLMEFTDVVLDKYSQLDGDKLGICGGSYGGFMCNWMIGNTTRFKAAASQRSIANYFSKCLTTDIGYYHNLSQVGGSPWVNSDKMWFHSPLKYVNNAITATLFIQSDEDYRCWMSDPIQMFTNLRSRGIPSKIALFHGENHELSRSGKPHNRISRLNEICGWFDTYLK